MGPPGFGKAIKSPGSFPASRLLFLPNFSPVDVKFSFLFQDNDQDVNLKKNFLPMISLLGIGTDGEINRAGIHKLILFIAYKLYRHQIKFGNPQVRADMLYKLIPYILPKDDSQQGFGSLLNDPLLFADFLSAPGMTRK